MVAWAGSFPANRHAGHTAREQIEQNTILLQNLIAKLDLVCAGLGSQGVDKDNPDVGIKHKGKSLSLSKEKRRLLNKRQATV